MVNVVGEWDVDRVVRSRLSHLNLLRARIGPREGLRDQIFVGFLVRIVII
eukprot:GDKH01018044.1.p3 GENE.GDKH01018044.1~~GDKH01018044.1.p3  ORF type:complete len:50 (-),score=9.75 GDKH01018044.1:235-384(-)